MALCNLRYYVSLALLMNHWYFPTEKLKKQSKILSVDVSKEHPFFLSTKRFAGRLLRTHFFPEARPPQRYHVRVETWEIVEKRINSPKQCLRIFLFHYRSLQHGLKLILTCHKYALYTKRVHNKYNTANTGKYFGRFMLIMVVSNKILNLNPKSCWGRWFSASDHRFPLLPQSICYANCSDRESEVGCTSFGRLS